MGAEDHGKQHSPSSGRCALLGEATKGNELDQIEDELSAQGSQLTSKTKKNETSSGQEGGERRAV